MEISKKIHNYEYAPGIATYGKQGINGENGLNGNNIFYTDINFTETGGDNLKVIADRIVGLKLPLVNALETISRPYQNGDFFFLADGQIYRLIRLEELTAHPTLGYAYFFELAGKINIDTNKALDYDENGRLSLDTSNYNGFDIITHGLASSIKDTNFLVNIASNAVDDNNNINLINLISVNNNINEDLKLYYNTLDNTYHISSNKPLLIDSSIVKINNEVAYDDIYTNYASVVTTNDPIAKFKYICDNITYNLDSDYLYLSYGVDISTKLDNLNDAVYVKVYQKDLTYLFNLDSSTILLNEIEDTSTIKACSLLYSTEIMLKKLS